jgi:hypothetical protein
MDRGASAPKPIDGVRLGSRHRRNGQANGKAGIRETRVRAAERPSGCSRSGRGRCTLPILRVLVRAAHQLQDTSIINGDMGIASP